MSPLHVAVIAYFDVLHLVTERSSEWRWSITFLEFRKIHRKTPVPESLYINLIHKVWVDLKNEEASNGGVL